MEVWVPRGSLGPHVAPQLSLRLYETHLWDLLPTRRGSRSKAQDRLKSSDRCKLCRHWTETYQRADFNAQEINVYPVSFYNIPDLLIVYSKYFYSVLSCLKFDPGLDGRSHSNSALTLRTSKLGSAAAEPFCTPTSTVQTPVSPHPHECWPYF